MTRDTTELSPAALALLSQHGITGIRNGSLSLPQLTTLASELGGTVESHDYRESRECEVLAPAAHHWGDAGDEHHVLLSVVNQGDDGPFRPSYNDLANRMVDGIQHCGPGCECGWDVASTAA